VSGTHLFVFTLEHICRLGITIVYLLGEFTYLIHQLKILMFQFLNDITRISIFLFGFEQVNGLLQTLDSDASLLQLFLERIGLVLIQLQDELGLFFRPFVLGFSEFDLEENKKNSLAHFSAL
jgi:hypothetical protein